MWMLAAAFASPPVWENQLDVEARHSATLTGFAVANLATGVPGALLADDPQSRAFHSTNAVWNTVNLAIGVGGWAGQRARRKRGFPGEDTAQKQARTLQRVLAINLGLDVLYVGTGVVLWTQGGMVNDLDLRGVGQSLVLQGAFLAGFDAHFLLAHHRATVRISPGGVAFRARF